MSTFTHIFTVIENATTKGHDTIVVHPSGGETLFVSSARGLGHAKDEVETLDAPLMAIEIDVWEAFELEGWNVERSGRGFIASRRCVSSFPTSAAIREAA